MFSTIQIVCGLNRDSTVFPEATAILPLIAWYTATPPAFTLWTRWRDNFQWVTAMD